MRLFFNRPKLAEQLIASGINVEKVQRDSLLSTFRCEITPEVCRIARSYFKANLSPVPQSIIDAETEFRRENKSQEEQKKKTATERAQDESNFLFESILENL